MNIQDDIIFKRINNLFVELGCDTIEFNGRQIYYSDYDGYYYRVDRFMNSKRDGYVYVIESAANYDEVEKNLFEDSDTYLKDMDDDEFIEMIKDDLINVYEIKNKK